jgi:hypothetical protein
MLFNYSRIAEVTFGAKEIDNVYITDKQILVNAGQDTLRIYFSSEKDMLNLVAALQGAITEYKSGKHSHKSGSASLLDM